MKDFADRHSLSVVVVHHIRKQNDSDVFNKVSGTTGLTGSADATFVLEKESRASDTAEEMAGREKQTEIRTVTDLLDEIESETLYLALVTVDRRTLQIVLLKMQGYSTKEIAPLVHLTADTVYARLAHLRKKLRKIL